MRVLFIGPNLLAGGAERQWSVLVPGLRRRGFDARLIALDRGGPFEAPLARAGVPFEVLGMRNQADILPLLRSDIVRRFTPEVVVSRGVSGLYVGELIARRRRARHIVNEHRQVGNPLTRRREALVRLIARRVDLVVTVTADQAGPWRERGVPAQRIVTIANGVASPAPVEDREGIRATLGLAAEDVAVVLVAGLRSEKRVPDFVDAIARARRSEPRLVGLVVGEGPERATVERAISELVPDGGVRLLGLRDDVERVLAGADLFALASDREASPMAILEAMAAGLPVVSTDVGGIAEMVDDGVSGILVAPGQPEAMAAALASLTADGQRRRALGDAGRALHREHWDSERMIDDYAALLTGGASALAPAQTNQGGAPRLTR